MLRIKVTSHHKKHRRCDKEILKNHKVTSFVMLVWTLPEIIRHFDSPQPPLEDEAHEALG